MNDRCSARASVLSLALICPVTGVGTVGYEKESHSLGLLEVC